MGAVGAAAQSIVFVIVGLWLAFVRPSTAVLISTEIGLITNFYLNNRFSFTGNPHSSLPLRFVRYHITVLGSFFCQWLFVFVVEQMTTNIYALLAAYAAGVLVGFAISYTGYRLWVWKNHEASSRPT
ncbi:MAG: GtrA family protein [Candidatus Paceibacterota bacterium]|jgi:putative flippase GtrA